MTFMWQLYTSDDQRLYAVRVHEYHVAMPERGWLLEASEGALQYPQGWTPRHVIGLSLEGRNIKAIAATTDAPIWSGAVSDFQFLDGNGDFQVATIITRVRERRLLIPPAAPLGLVVR
jgi:hypothetical protein